MVAAFFLAGVFFSFASLAIPSFASSLTSGSGTGIAPSAIGSFSVSFGDSADATGSGVASSPIGSSAVSLSDSADATGSSAFSSGLEVSFDMTSSVLTCSTVAARSSIEASSTGASVNTSSALASSATAFSLTSTNSPPPSVGSLRARPTMQASAIAVTYN